jgi:hypothetical protein
MACRELLVLGVIVGGLAVHAEGALARPGRSGGRLRQRRQRTRDRPGGRLRSIVAGGKEERQGQEPSHGSKTTPSCAIIHLCAARSSFARSSGSPEGAEG